MSTTDVTLSSQAKAHIDHWLTKFPDDQKQSAVLQALTFVQNENNGHLTTPLMDAVADYLGMPKIAVYEVATFYSMYEHKPVGRYKISVCTNISCDLCGSSYIESHLKEKFKIGFGETSEDGRFTLKEVECLAACGGAPAIMINDDYHENLTPETLDALLDSLE